MIVFIPVKRPTTPTLLLSLSVSILILILLRALSVYLARYLNTPPSVASDQKSTPADATQSPSRRTSLLARWSWPWKWEDLPLSVSLPVSLGMNEKAPVTVGVGAGVMRMNWQARHQGPNFEQPLPALYESQVPLSAAKLIMSRHTYRRPNPNRPPRHLTATTSTPRTSRRLNTMV